MAFRFPLAAVLRLREIAEEREERLLTGILRQMQQVREEISSLDYALAQTAVVRASALASVTHAAELQCLHERRESLLLARLAQEQQLAKFEELRHQQLSAYQQAHQSRTVLTDMRAAHREAWEGQRTRNEQKAADDIFLSRRLAAGAK